MDWGRGVQGTAGQSRSQRWIRDAGEAREARECRAGGREKSFGCAAALGDVGDKGGRKRRGLQGARTRGPRYRMGQVWTVSNPAARAWEHPWGGRINGRERGNCWLAAGGGRVSSPCARARSRAKKLLGRCFFWGARWVSAGSMPRLPLGSSPWIKKRPQLQNRGGGGPAWGEARIPGP